MVNIRVTVARSRRFTKPTPELIAAHNSPELEAWLLWLCSRAGRQRPSIPFPGAPASSVTLLELCEYADRHSVLGLVLSSLEREGILDTLTANEAAGFRNTLSFLRKKAQLWQFECSLLLTRFRMAGLHAVLLKGAALQATAYREPAERTYGDIDLLFPEGEIKAAMQLLGQLGYVAPADERAHAYEERHFHYVMDKPNGFKVEVHWALERPDSPWNLETEAFVANTHTVKSRALGEFVTTTAEYSALHLSVQNIENGFGKLSRLVDVDRLVSSPGFRWPLLVEPARASNARVVVDTTLRLCAELLGTEVPETVFEALGASAAARKNLSALQPTRVVMEQQALHLGPVILLVDLWCRDTAKSRIAGLRDIMLGRDLELGRIGDRGSVVQRFMTNAARMFTLTTYQLRLFGQSPAALVQQKTQRTIL